MKVVLRRASESQQQTGIKSGEAASNEQLQPQLVSDVSKFNIFHL
jgi:hypothetical protein